MTILKCDRIFLVVLLKNLDNLFFVQDLDGVEFYQQRIAYCVFIVPLLDNYLKFVGKNSTLLK